MKTTTTRPATAEERAALEALLSPQRPGKPEWVAAIMVGVPATFALFVFLNVLLEGVLPPAARLGLAGAVGAVVARFFARRATARREEALRPAPEIQEVLRKDLEAGTVSVDRFEVEAIVKVAPDRPRFVRTTWLAKLADGRVALLVAPDLEELELAGEFPATAFEIATGEASHFVVSVTRTGEKLLPAKVRAPFTDGEWDELGDEADDPVPWSWDEVLERAAHHPLGGKAKKGP